MIEYLITLTLLWKPAPWGLLGCLMVRLAYLSVCLLLTALITGCLSAFAHSSSGIICVFRTSSPTLYLKISLAFRLFSHLSCFFFFCLLWLLLVTLYNVTPVRSWVKALANCATSTVCFSDKSDHNFVLNTTNVAKIAPQYVGVINGNSTARTRACVLPL